MTIGSLPRLRLYTSLSQYAQVMREYLTGRWLRGDVTIAEQAIAQKVGARYAVLTSMARVGIHLALKHTIQPGQKVICSPYTITDVINMIVSAGGVPLFADLDTNTCNVSASSIEDLLASHTDVGAVMVTHFYGLACQVTRIRDACQAHGVPLLEDAAQAFGVTVQGRSLGTFGRAGVFSFGLYKNVNSFYGGAVVTDDEELACALRAEVQSMPPTTVSFYFKKVIAGAIIDLITWPPLFRIFTFQIFRLGIQHNIEPINNKLKIDTNPRLAHEVPPQYMVRPSGLQARLIVQQLPNVLAHTEVRRRHAERYRAGLAGLPQLRLPPLVNREEHMYWYFPIQYDSREELVKFAMRHGRDITLSYHRNCAALPCFAEFARDCPNAQRTADSVIYLPTYPRYTEQEIDKTVEVIRRFFAL